MSTGMLNKLKVVAIAAITLLALIVVLQNTQSVETHLLFLTLAMPNAALLFGTLIIGFTIGVLTAGHIVAIAKRAMPTDELKKTPHVARGNGRDGATGAPSSPRTAGAVGEQ